MSKLPRGLQRIGVGPWPMHLYVTRSKDAAKWLFESAKCNPAMAASIDDSSATATTYGWETSAGLVVLVYFPKMCCDASIANVANTASHEATHVLQMLNSYIGEEEPGMEAEAYFLGYVTQALIEMVFNKKDHKEIKVR